MRTARGHRIRSLHQAYAEKFDDQADESVAEQPIIQAAILRVAKLQVIVERLQDELLKPKRHNRQLGDELVRHENMLRRAKEELMALIPEPLKLVGAAPARTRTRGNCQWRRKVRRSMAPLSTAWMVS